MNKLLSRIPFLLSAGLCSVGASAEETGPKVVVSISPVHSIVSGVAAGAAVPTLLLPGTASPHAYQLRPSQARTLHDAGLVIWIGEDLESFLERPIRNLASDSAILTLSEFPGMRLVATRRGGIWHSDDDHDDHHDDDHDDHHDDDHDDHHDDDHDDHHDDDHDDHHDDHDDDRGEARDEDHDDDHHAVAIV